MNEWTVGNVENFIYAFMGQMGKKRKFVYKQSYKIVKLDSVIAGICGIIRQQVCNDRRLGK